MRFDNTAVFNIEGAMRGMRFPMKGIGDTAGDIIGDKDMDLAGRLWNASENENLAHSKFLRQIMLSVDISAPLYIWSELDTYKIATTANSESTMHKLTKDAKSLTLADFECDPENEDWILNVIIPELQRVSLDTSLGEIKRLRLLKQKLPTSYIQKRHWTANYEVVRNMYNQRVFRPHRLVEWNTDFGNWAESLPYADEFITKRKERKE